MDFSQVGFLPNTAMMVLVVFRDRLIFLLL